MPLVIFLVAPLSVWGSCTSQKVGGVTFSDCPDEGHGLNNPAANGVVLQSPLSATGVGAVKLVPPHGKLDMSTAAPEPVNKATTGAKNDPGSSPTGSSVAPTKPSQEVTKNPAIQQ